MRLGTVKQFDDGSSYGFIEDDKNHKSYFVFYKAIKEEGYKTLKVGDRVKYQLAQGKNVVLEIEVQGALQVMEKCPDATTIFIVPPSFEELERRIRGRRTEDEAIVQERLAKARKEIATKDEYKYVVENDDVMLAKEQIATIIKNHRTNQD